jgi:DNA-binding MarR family transcriptional regulator
MALNGSRWDGLLPSFGVNAVTSHPPVLGAEPGATTDTSDEVSGRRRDGAGVDAGVQDARLAAADRDRCACGDVAWLLARASHALAAKLGCALDALGVGMRGFVVLKMLRRNPVPTQLALAQSTGIDKTTLVAVLDRLEACQLVQRSPDPRDRRARVVKLTDHGRYMLDVAEITVRDIERAVLDHLPPDEREPLLRALPTLVDATGELGTNSGSCV